MALADSVGLEEQILGLPEGEDNSDDGDDEEIVDELPDISEVEFNGQTVQFPGISDETIEMIIKECLLAFRSGNNLLVEIPADIKRRLAILTALLHHHHSELPGMNVDDDGLHEVPGQGQTSSSSHRRKKIYFANKSFEELKETLNDLKKFRDTGYLQNISLAVLAHPSQLCSNCEDHLLCSSPPFAGNGYNFIEENGTVHDLRHLAKKSKSEKFCSYRYNRWICEDANFVLCTQEFIISSALRQKYSTNLDNTITIFDDGGNIEVACYEEASTSITTLKLAQAGECFKSLGEIFNAINQNRHSEDLQQVAQRVSTLSNSLKSFATAINAQPRGNPASSEKLQGILKSSGLFGKELIENFNETLRHALMLMGEDDEIKASVKERRIDNQHVLNVQNLLSSLNYICNSIANDFALEISTYKPPGATQPSVIFNISYANLSAILEPIMSKASSVVVSSACLPPIPIFHRELSVIPDQRFHETVTVPDQTHTRCMFAYCSVGPNRVPFELNHQNRGREAVSDEAGEAILNMVRTIPNGIIVFFPSIAALNDKIRSWKNDENRADSLWNEMKESKHLFCELDFMKAEDAKRKLKDFRKLCLVPIGNRNGAILFALCRNKVSEVMDFETGEVRCIISVGIPYHSTRAFSIRTKEANILGRGNLGGVDAKRINNLWYNAEAFHNLNQKFAHCIRKEQDWFIGLIFDKRMEEKVRSKDAELLQPSYMQTKWKSYTDFTRLVGDLNEFVNG